MSKQVLIIGGGLGGLFLGKLLTRERWGVTILEQGAQPGGALQTFVRDGVRFDTGFHSVGGMEPGGPLRKILEPFGLNYLPWEKAGEDECIDGGPFMRLSSGTPDEFEHVAKPYEGSTWRLKGGGKTLVDALVKESRRSKPRMERNPARFGTVGYLMPVRRRSWRSLI